MQRYYFSLRLIRPAAFPNDLINSPCEFNSFALDIPVLTFFLRLLDKTKHCKDTIKYIKQNLSSNNYVLIVIVYKSNFFILNKVLNETEYIVSSKNQHFDLLYKYLLN